MGFRRSPRRQTGSSRRWKAPCPPAYLLLLERRASVDAIVVFRLQSILLALHLDDRGVEERIAGNEGHEGTLVSDLFAEETNVQSVPPSVSVRIGDGLGQLVRK